MTDLTRSEFCTLVKITEAALDVRASRGLLPKFSGLKRKRGTYQPMDALVMIITEHLVEDHAKALSRAVELASQANDVVVERMGDIAKTLFIGAPSRKPKPDIFFALVLASKDDKFPEFTSVCGTRAEIVKRFPSPIRIEEINISQCARVLRHRADSAGIDLTEFWSMKNV